MTLDTIYGSKKAARMTSPACVVTTMAFVAVVVANELLLLLMVPGSSRRRSCPEQSCTMARAKAAPWCTLQRATVVAELINL